MKLRLTATLLALSLAGAAQACPDYRMAHNLPGAGEVLDDVLKSVTVLSLDSSLEMATKGKSGSQLEPAGPLLMGLGLLGLAMASRRRAKK